MIRFVRSNADGLPPKRSQSLRACEDCRKRKKRCMHNTAAGGDGGERPVPSDGNRDQTTSTLPEHQSDNLSSSISPAGSGAANLLHRQDVGDAALSNGETGDRFVGDLNPESIFLAATSPETQSSGDNVGIWVPRKALRGLRKQMDNHADLSSPGTDALLSNVLLPYVQLQCQQSMPPSSCYASLYRIYLQEVHPIFPVIDLESLEGGAASDLPGTVILKQSICLAASASPRAVGHLQLLTSNGNLVETHAASFAGQMASAIRSAVDLGLVKDRVSIVQALTITALFTQFSYQHDLAAEITARAISHAQTMGLHLDLAGVGKDRTYLTRLFCSVWALDKLNAAFQGRPTLMHEQDFGRDLEEATAQQESGFQLLLRIISRLDRVIALYRPAGSSRSPSTIAPVSFESLIHQCDAVRVSSLLLGTLELLYHAVNILSCRSKSSFRDTSALDTREMLSAVSIVSIIGTEYGGRVTYIPFAPYALSLSLRVFYRELRFGATSPFTRNRVRKQLLDVCELLRTFFGDSFPSAMKVVDLAEQTVNEMKKIYNSILNRSRAHSEAINPGDQQEAAESALPDLNEIQHGRGPDTSDIHPTSWEGLPDLDVFEYFDSDFHLDAIDAALADNMVFAFPPIVGGVNGLGEATTGDM